LPLWTPAAQMLGCPRNRGNFRQTGKGAETMATAHMKWAAVMRLLRKGLVTQSEAADLAGTSVYVIKEWAQRERIDIATTRATYLLTVWQSELAVERAKRWTERELIIEQTRLDRAWEKHLGNANLGSRDSRP
jgi:hypothetical protein